MTAGEVKSRASAGAVLLTGRGVGLQALGFVGNLALARLLVPEDFGIVAVGLTMLNVGRVLAGAGLGSALIARPDPPTREEFRALCGLQLSITTAIAAVVAVAALIIGGNAPVTAFMMLALPLMAFRAPALLVFQRELEFGAQLKVEIAEMLVYLAVAIGLALLGLEAWSLAIALVARALAGTAIAVGLSPLGLVIPSVDFARLRGILGFGWRFQATGFTQVGFETALTAGIGAIAGLTALGIWSFTVRLLGIPRLLFESLWTVGFPAFSRLMHADQDRDMGPLLERTVGTFAVAATAILCPLAATSPALVPLLFGSDWTDVSLILPSAALGLAIAGPIGLAASGYFYARGDATTGLQMSVVADVVRIAVAFALLPVIGIAAVGLAAFAGSLAGMAFTLPRVRRASGARLGFRVAGPVSAGCVAGLAGWILADHMGANLASAATSGLVALSVWLSLMLVLARPHLLSCVAMVRSVMRSAFIGLRRKRAQPPVVVPSSGA